MVTDFTTRTISLKKKYCTCGNSTHNTSCLLDKFGHDFLDFEIMTATDSEVEL